ncbi:MAG: M48 family metallopeptidase [Spirochaetes bacterium]|nr:M48 family metallopeptidase [Spirochaetota bacterium]
MKKYKVHMMERIGLLLKILASALCLLAVFALSSVMSKSGGAMGGAGTMQMVLIMFIYVGFIVLFFVFRKIFMIGFIRGNGIRITEKQFPDVFKAAQQMLQDLAMRKMPNIYVMQSDGVLNAYATRFKLKNYIVIYSSIFEMAMKDKDILHFIMAHELGHVKRNHASKNFWLCLSSIVPFLQSFYSRGCEYTCDNIGKMLSPNGAENGLVLLVAGKELYEKVDVAEYMATTHEDNTFITKFVELFQTHPHMPKRIRNIK